jgi:hypothetical protein
LPLGGAEFDLVRGGRSTVDDLLAQEVRPVKPRLPEARSMKPVSRLLVLVWIALAWLACAQACSGKLAGLMSYAGTYTGEAHVPLDANPAVRTRLDRLPESVREHLARNLDARGAVDLIGCHLVLSGNAAHRGGEENAVLDVNLYSGAVTVGLLSRGRIDIYLDEDSTAGTGYTGSVPPAVRWWAAMAAGAFSAAQRPPPGTRVVRAGRK